MNPLAGTQQTTVYQDSEQLKVQVAELNEQNQALMMQYMAIMELYNQATVDAEALKQASVSGRAVKEQLTRDLEEALRVRDTENAQLKAQIALLNSQFKEEKARCAAELRQKDNVIAAKERVIATKNKALASQESLITKQLEQIEMQNKKINELQQKPKMFG